MESFKSEISDKEAIDKTNSVKPDESSVNDFTSEVEKQPYYRICNSGNNADFNWMITLSKYEFPWREISFGKYTPKDCYLKYIALVQDAQTFLKKVLGNKEKY